MAETQLSVVRQILDLTETMDEALMHVQRSEALGRPPRATIELFADVIHAFAEIQAAMDAAFPQENEDDRYNAAMHCFNKVCP